MDKIYRIRLMVGGMESISREAAVQMLFTDEPTTAYLPRSPKVLSAMGVPIIFFIPIVYEEGTVPELPMAFNAEFFSHSFDYTYEEFGKIIDEMKHPIPPM